jgi:hypothetical protein
MPIGRRRPHHPHTKPALPRMRGIRGKPTQRLKITPDIARNWLRFCPNSKGLDLKKVDTLATAMKTGTWEAHPDTEQWLLFNKGGKLIDGKHRLHAIIKSNTAIELWVRNAPWLG